MKTQIISIKSGAIKAIAKILIEYGITGKILYVSGKLLINCMD